MKKILAVFCLLCLLSAGALWGIARAVSADQANVTIQENILYGDKSHAQGVTVETKAQYGHHLFWDTTYQVGATPTCDTRYRFSTLEQISAGDRKNYGIVLDLDLQYGYDLAASAEESTGLQKAYRELYEETEPGTTGKKYIRLQDYYEYYPIRVSIDLPGTLWQGNDYAQLSDDYRNERSVWDRFNEFLKIPIPEDLPGFQITITKGERSISSGIGATAMDWEYYLNPVSAYTQNRCFFAIGNRFIGEGMADDMFADTSLIPGGYGLYSFEYKTVRNSKNTHANATIFYPGYETGVEEDTLKMVYPLEQEAVVVHMIISPDETKLLLFTMEQDLTYLTVIDIASMTQLDKFQVIADEHYIFNENDDFIVLDGSDHLSVIEASPDGDYRLAFTVPKENTDMWAYHMGIATKMDFDGEKLVMVNRLYEKLYGTLELCSFSLTIYDRTGLLYQAEYESSLSVNPDINDYSYNCLPEEFQVFLP